jgi:tetratricopeptide (TPR) repeat protein
MFENEDKRFANEYRAIEEKADRVMMRLLKSKDILDTDLLLCGAAYGMRGFFAVHEDEYFKALSLGLHALHILKRLKFKNPAFVDSDLGIGMYEYWRSVFTNRYWFLPFFPDRRKEGIKKIRRVVDSGLYTKELAVSNLIFVLYNEQQYKEAEQQARVMLQKYPNNIVLRMLLGRTLFFEKRYEESIAELEKVLKVDPSITKAYYVMAFPYFKMKNIKKSRELMERFLATNPTEDVYKSSAYYWLGRADEEEKKSAAAIKNYEISYELYKKDNDAKRRCLKLKGKEGYK